MLGVRHIAIPPFLAMLAAPLGAQLAISTRAAITDNYGVEVQQDGTQRAVYAATNKVAGREHLAFRWHIDLSNANMLTGQAMTIWRCRDQQGVDIAWLDLRGGASGGMELRAYARNGAATIMTADVPVAAIHLVEIEWRKGAGDGLLRLTVDHVERGLMQSLDSDRSLLLAYYGAPNGMTGFTGWYAFDDVWIDDLSGQWPEQLAVWIEKPYNEGMP